MSTHISIHPSYDKPGKFGMGIEDTDPTTVTLEYADSDYGQRTEVTLFIGKLSAEALRSAATSLAATSDKLFEVARERSDMKMCMGWEVHASHNFVPEYGDDNMECSLCAVRPYNDDARLPCEGV